MDSYDDEEIVMTPLKNGNSTTVRIERLKEEEICYENALHIASGPYEGVVINRCTKELPILENPDRCLSFIASMYNTRKDDIREYKERRKLQFWLKPEFKADRDSAYRYFKDLIVPEGFPKYSDDFIKKALALVMAYPMLSVIDLEITPEWKEDPDVGDDGIDDEADGKQKETNANVNTVLEDKEDEVSEEDTDEYPIVNYITVLTPAKYDYQYLPEVPVSHKTSLVFKLKASCDAYIALCSTYGDNEYKSYELAIGEQRNFRSSIRDGAHGPVLHSCVTSNVLIDIDLRTYWISWSGGSLQLGKGDKKYKNTIMEWVIPDDKKYSINCLAVATGPGSTGVWEFAEYGEEEIVMSDKSSLRSWIRKTFLWLARKHKMLRSLEEAYPKSLDTSTLLRASKINLSETKNAVASLKELQERGLVSEIATGIWMRSAVGQEEKQHTVKPMDYTLQIRPRDQPKVAIITSLFCEKQAVDAMIENKTSFIRYRAEGETNVYTIGRIGSINVVSTKLSRTSSSEGRSSTTGARNTITRLLGTFNKVKHIFLVGVCGGIPHFSDYAKHTRLGDVLVSNPAETNGPIYIYCQKIDKVGNENAEYSYMTRSWESKDNTLQRYVNRLKAAQDNDPYFKYPWEKYLEEAKVLLRTPDCSFERPPEKSDRLFKRLNDGELIEVEHPRPARSMLRLQREGKPTIRHGPIGSGKFVSLNEDLRASYASITHVIGYDCEFDAVLEGIEGSRCDSFILIRGVSDYGDGQQGKEWQPYASLCAAAYMKAVLLTLPL